LQTVVGGKGGGLLPLRLFADLDHVHEADDKVDAHMTGTLGRSGVTDLAVGRPFQRSTWPFVHANVASVSIATRFGLCCVEQEGISVAVAAAGANSVMLMKLMIVAGGVASVQTGALRAGLLTLF
jgi:hypothetical protein